jgi:hypothetical protein
MTLPDGPIASANAPAQHAMDKKAKKRIDLLRKKTGDLQQRLAGARQQMDDPHEVEQLESEIAAAQAEIEKLKNS